MHSQKNKKVFIVYYQTPWSYTCNYVSQITERLAQKGNAIAFNPLSLITIKNILCNKTTRQQCILMITNPTIRIVPAIALLPFQRFHCIETLNRHIANVLFTLYCQLRYKNQKKIYWIFSPEYAKYQQYLKTGYIVYDRVDQYLSIDRDENTYLKRIDTQMSTIADLTVVNSPYAEMYIKPYAKKVLTAPWGFDEQLLNQKINIYHNQISTIPHPRIGIVGHLDYRTNWKLMRVLVDTHPNWNFIFIGDVDTYHHTQNTLLHVYTHLSDLKKKTNVYFTGEIPKQQIMSTIAAVDVCLVPYDTKQASVRGLNPMKIYEYLAVGKPIVSIPLSSLPNIPHGIYVAATVESFSKGIEMALTFPLSKQLKQTMRTIAYTNSWSAHADTIWKTIHN